MQHNKNCLGTHCSSLNTTSSHYCHLVWGYTLIQHNQMWGLVKLHSNRCRLTFACPAITVSSKQLFILVNGYRIGGLISSKIELLELVQFGNVLAPLIRENRKGKRTCGGSGKQRTTASTGWGTISNASASSPYTSWNSTSCSGTPSDHMNCARAPTPRRGQRGTSIPWNWWS